MKTMNLPPEKNIEAGTQIIEQGEPAMAAFLIVEGEANVLLKRDGVETRIAGLKNGDIFGETALFKGSDYGASVVAITHMTVQEIPPAILDDKIAKCDPMIRALIRMLIVRLRQANEKKAS